MTPTTSYCRTCNAPIEWVITERGKRMPIDANPHPDGRFKKLPRVATEHGMATKVRYLPDAELADARAGVSALYTSHFATCPDAADHRKAG